MVLHGRRADLMAAIAECDVLLCLHDEPSAEDQFEVAAALGFGVPMITVASGPFSAAIACESGEAGLCFPWDRGAGSMARPLAEAMLRYLKEPELMTAHRAQARRVFGDSAPCCEGRRDLLQELRRSVPIECARIREAHLICKMKETRGRHVSQLDRAPS